MHAALEIPRFLFILTFTLALASAWPDWWPGFQVLLAQVDVVRRTAHFCFTAQGQQETHGRALVQKRHTQDPARIPPPSAVPEALA